MQRTNGRFLKRNTTPLDRLDTNGFSTDLAQGKNLLNVETYLANLQSWLKKVGTLLITSNVSLTTFVPAGLPQYPSYVSVQKQRFLLIGQTVTSQNGLYYLNGTALVRIYEWAEVTVTNGLAKAGKNIGALLSTDIRSFIKFDASGGLQVKLSPDTHPSLLIDVNGNLKLDASLLPSGGGGGGFHYVDSISLSQSTAVSGIPVGVTFTIVGRYFQRDATVTIDSNYFENIVITSRTESFNVSTFVVTAQTKATVTNGSYTINLSVLNGTAPQTILGAPLPSIGTFNFSFTSPPAMVLTNLTTFPEEMVVGKTQIVDISYNTHDLMGNTNTITFDRGTVQSTSVNIKGRWTGVVLLNSAGTLNVTAFANNGYNASNLPFAIGTIFADYQYDSLINMLGVNVSQPAIGSVAIASIAPTPTLNANIPINGESNISFSKGVCEFKLTSLGYVYDPNYRGCANIGIGFKNNARSTPNSPYQIYTNAPSEFRYFVGLYSDGGPSYRCEIFDPSGSIYINAVSLNSIIRMELTTTGCIFKINGVTVATSTFVPLAGMYVAIARGELFNGYRVNNAYSTYNSALIENLRIYSLP